MLFGLMNYRYIHHLYLCILLLILHRIRHQKQDKSQRDQPVFRKQIFRDDHTPNLEKGRTPQQKLHSGLCNKQEQKDRKEDGEAYEQSPFQAFFHLFARRLFAPHGKYKKEEAPENAEKENTV